MPGCWWRPGLSGIANAVYHPADYAILSAKVKPARIGRAFSVHTFAGMLGNAVAPLTMLVLVPRVGTSGALILAGSGRARWSRCR